MPGKTPAAVDGREIEVGADLVTVQQLDPVAAFSHGGRELGRHGRLPAPDRPVSQSTKPVSLVIR